MSDEEKDKKETMESIQIILKTTEEIKSYIKPLVKGNENAINLLDRHESAILTLTEKLIGLDKKLRKDEVNIEYVYQEVEKISHEFKQKEKNIKELRDSLQKSEFNWIKRINSKINKNENLYDEDIEFIDRVIDKYGEKTYLLSIKGELLNRIKSKEEAKKFIDDVIKKYPDNSDLNYVKGTIYMDIDMNESIRSFQKTLELDETNINKHAALHNMAIVYYDNDEFEKSLEKINESIGYFEDCSEAWDIKATILSKLDRVPEALGACEKAIEIDNKSHGSYLTKGLILCDMGKEYLGEAINNFLISLNYKETPEGNFNLAKAYRVKGDLDDALHYVNIGISLVSNDPHAFCEKGIIMMLRNNINVALDNFLISKKIFEDNNELVCSLLLKQIAKLYKELGKKDKEKEINALIKKLPKN